MSVKFDNETKPFSKGKPFARIKSRNFKPQEPLASGLGYDCGCRNPDKDYEATFIAGLLIKGVLDVADKALPIPPQLRDAANRALKSGTGKDLDDFKKELESWLSSTLEGFMFASALRMVPSWVPVNRSKFDRKFKEVDREVQGILSRSFQSCTDLPLMPWNRFYNWNFHVRLDEGNGFQHVIGQGNIPNESEQAVINVDPDRPAFDMRPTSGIGPVGGILENSLECVWDAGALSLSPGNAFDVPPSRKSPADKAGDFLPGVMFHPGWPFWPMTNDHFWAQGRWVYDCTHVVDGDLFRDEKDRMWTQIHPCRAIASYRYEGFKFDENEKAVPASRLLFFTCRKGGYFDFPPYSELDPQDDPQFIVDLPEAPAPEDLTWTIGRTPDFNMNTVVLRPRLLIKTEFAPFRVPNTLFAEGVHFAHKVDPKIEPIKSNPERKLPDQVKITIPISKLPKEAVAYGVVISLGWSDPANILATKVKKVTVRFDNLQDLDKDGELRFKLGVNGHWVFAPLHDIDDESVSLKGGSPTRLFLPEDARIAVNVHGMKRHGYGEFFEEKNDANRQLFVGGLFQFGSESVEETLKEIQKKIDEGQKMIEVVLDGKKVQFAAEGLKKLLEIGGELLKKRRPVRWLEDVDQENNGVASAVARELFFKPFPIFNRKDEPLGLMDSNLPFGFGFETGRAGSETGTPVFDHTYEGDIVADIVKDLKKSGAKSRKVILLAHKTKVAGDAHMLSYNFFNDSEGRDYVLQFSIQVEDQ